MCSDPLDPGGEVRGCSLGCTFGVSDIPPLVFIAAGRSIGVSELKRNILGRVCFGCGEISGNFPLGGVGKVAT